MKVPENEIPAIKEKQVFVDEKKRESNFKAIPKRIKYSNEKAEAIAPAFILCGLSLI